MPKVLIIGSGPAAAAVALAATSIPRAEVQVVDLGERLEPEKGLALEEAANLDPADWPRSVTEELSQPLQTTSRGELPQKLLFGSDFPYRDRGQLTDIAGARGANVTTVSGAFGGFSNVWGAQIMPFSRATIDRWPVSYEDLLPHYTTILRHIPYAGVDDDYSEIFPLLATAAALPQLSPGIARLLNRYHLRRSAVRRHGITLGHARLAIDAAKCISCGLCLTGCPFGLIYSASHTLTELIAAGRVRYTPGMLASQVGEDADGAWVNATAAATGDWQKFRADHVFVACGGVGSTRLVLHSERSWIKTAKLLESVQIVLPFLSTRPQPDPRTMTTFTLNQCNMLIAYGRPGLDLAQLHLYPYNSSFDDALPAPVRAWSPMRRAILRRAVAAVGYLPSWASPGIELHVGQSRQDGLPPLSLNAAPNPSTARVLRRVFCRVLRVAPALDLWPILPALRISGAAKSYHFGGSFPHVHGRPRPGALETDTLGRLAEWRRIHIVDGAVLPSVPATTFTLSVMANAHRIASIALDGGV
jgi:choline dehydrogenase-like flavoprotein